MISKISKVQNINQASNAPISINTSLPISIKVSEKTGFNRYVLKFHNRSLSTKSAKPLRVGANYWGEIESTKDMIVIKNLYEKPEFSESEALNDALNIIEMIISQDDLKWLYSLVFDALANATDAHSFRTFSAILLALQKNTLHLPFFYNGNFGLLQMQKFAQKCKIYLLFGNFAPILFELENGKISRITTPFYKVASALKSRFECEIAIGNVNLFWQDSTRIVDLRG